MEWRAAIIKLIRLSSGVSATRRWQTHRYSRSWICELVWGYNRTWNRFIGERHQNPREFFDDCQPNPWQLLNEQPDGDLVDGPLSRMDEPDSLGFHSPPARLLGFICAKETVCANSCPEHQESGLQWSKNFLWKKNWRRL